MSGDSACDHASTGSRAEAHTRLPHTACQNSVHTRHVTVESACGSIDGAHALRTVSRQHTPGDGVCVSVEARAGISNTSTARQPLLSHSSLPNGVRDSSFAASPRRQWRAARRVVKNPTVSPWRARACAVAVVVVALCFAGGMYAYDRIFVTPPVSWTKTTPAAAAHQCPYFNASVRDCHTPPPPSVVATAPWTAQLCWPRCPSFSWYEVDMDDWWSNHPMEFVPAYWGNATSCTVTNLLPASTYHVRVRMWTAPNASHSNYSATATIHTDTLGHCGNTNDVQVLARQRASTRASIVSCFEGCMLEPQPEQCTTHCISARVGLSTACSRCWYNDGKCTGENCLVQCKLPNSVECAACSDKYCRPACVACTGIEPWAFPK